MMNKKVKIALWTLRAFAWPTLLLAWLVSIIAVGAWMVQTTLYQQERSHAPPGKMYLVQGEWVHLDCRGDRKKTMLFLESGAMGWSTVWEWFLLHGQQNFYVCAWDRPGMGWSQPTTRPADSQASAAVLHELLAQQGLNKKPFILVGHSLGGLYALSYQKMFPRDVQSLVLLDPAHPQQLQRLPEETVNKTFEQVGFLSASLPLLDFGVGRGVVEMRKEASLFRLPPWTRSSVIHVSSSRQHLNRAVEEYMSWKPTASFAQVQSLGDMPLLVISASDREAGNRTANERWWSLHEGMSHLSSHGYWTVIPNTAHQSLIMKESSVLLILEKIEQQQSIP